MCSYSLILLGNPQLRTVWGQMTYPFDPDEEIELMIAVVDPAEVCDAAAMHASFL